MTVRFPATGFSCRIWLSPAPRKTRRGAPVKRPAEFSALSNTPVRVLHIQDALFNIYMRLQEHREREHSFVLVRCKRSWCNLFVNTFGSKGLFTRYASERAHVGITPSIRNTFAIVSVSRITLCRYDIQR